MKSNMIIGFILMLISGQSFCQDIQFEWNKIAGSFGTNSGKSIICDNRGHVYVAGEFKENFSYGDSLIKGFTDRNIFILKLDLDGNLIWSKCLGSNTPGNIYDYPGQICFDTSMNIVGTGTFSNTLISDDTIINSHGGTDFFILKLKDSGETISLLSQGGTGNENSNSVCTNQDNHLYVCGGFEGILNLAGQTMTSSGHWQYSPYGDSVFIYDKNGFFAEYDSQNHCVFAKQICKNWSDLYSIITDSDDNVYTTGFFSLYNALTDTIANEIGNFMVFKYDQQGNFLNLIQEGSSNNYIKGKSLAIDHDNNLYVSGYIGCSGCIFGDSLLPDSYNDAFLVKYSPQGEMKWINLIGQYHQDYDGNENSGNSIVIDKNNNVLLTGYFDGIELNGHIITGNNSSIDFLLMNFDPNGGINSIGTFGYPSWDGGESVAIDTSNTVYFTGYTYLGNMSSDLPSYIFIAKVDSIFPLLTGDEILADRIKIFPNPSSGVIQVDLPDNADHPASLGIFNMEGIMVYSTAITGKHSEMTLHGMKPGLYVIKILDRNNQYFRKLLIR